MKSKTHNLTTLVTAAIGPIFREHSDYNIIVQTMSLVMARIAQSTPDKGEERDVLAMSYATAQDALEKFLLLEEQIEAGKAAQKAKLDTGIGDFSQFAAGNPGEYDNLVAFNGGMGPGAQAVAEEIAGKAPYDKALMDDINQVIRAAGGIVEGSAEDHPDNGRSLQDGGDQEAPAEAFGQ